MTFLLLAKGFAIVAAVRLIAVTSSSASVKIYAYTLSLLTATSLRIKTVMVTIALFVVSAMMR